LSAPKLWLQLREPQATGNIYSVSVQQKHHLNVEHTRDQPIVRLAPSPFWPLTMGDFYKSMFGGAEKPAKAPISDDTGKYIAHSIRLSRATIQF
jgi:hypothetical protein